MKKFLCLVFSLTILALCCSQDQKEFTIGPKDLLQLSMTDVFKGSGPGTYTFSTNSSLIKILDSYSSAQARDLDLSFMTKIDYVTKASRTIVAYIYDKSKLAYFDTNTNSPSALPGFKKNENFNQGEACYDVVYWEAADSMLVLCETHAGAGEEGKPWNVTLYSIDYLTGELNEQSKLEVVMGGDTKVANSLRMKLVESTSDSSEPYLMIYNKGLSDDQGLKNPYIVKCGNLDASSIEKLTCSTIGLSKEIAGLRTLEDIFPIQDRLLVIGHEKDSNKLIAKIASLDSSPVPEPEQAFESVKGQIGLFRMDRYFFYQPEQNKLFICKSYKNWNENCRSFLFNLPEQWYIFDAEFASGVFFASLRDRSNNDYVGFIMVDTANEKTIRMPQGASGLLFDGNILVYRDAKVQPNKILKTFIQDDYILVDAKAVSPGDLKYGETLFLKIEAKNKNEEVISTVLKVTVAESYTGKPSVNPAIHVPSYADFMYPSHSQWSVRPQALSGNGLSFSWKHRGESGPYLEDSVLHTNKTKVKFVLDNYSNPSFIAFSDFMMGEGFLVGVTKSSKLVVFRCFTQNQISIECQFQSSTNLPPDSKPSIVSAGKFSDSHVYAVLNYETSSTLFFLTPQSTAKTDLSDPVIDATGLITKKDKQSDDNTATVALIIKEQKNPQVVFFSHNLASKSVEKWDSNISVANVESEVFCPLSLYATGDDRLLVASTCKTDSRIYVFDINRLDLALDDRPINDEYELSHVCFYNSKVLVGGLRKRITTKTEFYLTDHSHNFLAKEEYAHRDFGAPDIVNLHCINEAGLFVISYPNEKEDGYVYDLYYTDEASGRANKRLHSRLQDSRKNLKMFRLSDRVILATLDSDGSIYAFSSFTEGPILNVQVGRKQDSEPPKEDQAILEGSSTLSLKDFQGNLAKIKVSTHIINQDYKVEVSRKQIPNSGSRVVDLDEVLDLRGPVRNITLEGASTDSINLIHRLKKQSQFVPEENNEGLYKFITLAGNCIVAARVSRNVSPPKLFVDVFSAEDKYQFSLTLPIRESVSAFAASQQQDALILFYVESTSAKKDADVLMKAVVKDQKVEKKTMLIHDEFSKIEVATDSPILMLALNNENELSAIKIGDNSFEILDTLPNIQDFQSFLNQSSLQVATIKPEDSAVLTYLVDVSDKSEEAFKLLSTADIGPRTILKSISCQHYDDLNLVCLHNTAGAYILERFIEIATGSTIETYHMKFNYYEPSSLVLVNDLIIGMTKSLPEGLKNYQLQVWKLGKAGGKGRIMDGYLTKDLFEPQIDDRDNLPIAVKKTSSGDRSAQIITGYASEKATLLFIRVGGLALEFQTQKYEADKVLLKFAGTKVATMTLAHLFNSKEIVERHPWVWILWTVIIILILALVIITVMLVKFFLKRRQRGIYDLNESSMSYSKAGETYSQNTKHSTTMKPIADDESVPA